MTACQSTAGRIYLAPETFLVKITEQHLRKHEPSGLTVVWAVERARDELRRKDGGGP